MTQVSYFKLVQSLNDLFISSKQSRIEQQADGTYHVKRNGLANEHLIAHLTGTMTVGVFSGEVYSKYICFDVDTGKYNRSIARNDVRVIKHVLINEFAIPHGCISTVDSGNKGYHIYLCFDDVIKVDYLRAFYREVLARTGYDPTQVELRPTATQGVKLPLGIHRKTGNRCYFVDTRTPRFKQLPMDYIHEIKQLDTKMFIANNQLKDLYELQTEEIYLQSLDFLREDEAKAFTKALYSLDLTEYQLEHAHEDIAKMLETNTLIYPNTRNKYTLLIAIYLKQQDYTQQEVVRIINSIMLNSKRQYTGLVQSSETHIQRETRKITSYVFKANISMSNGSVYVALYESEIRTLLSIKGLHLQRLYLSLLIHSKRHQQIGADTFYMAYSVMSNYGNAKDRGTLRKYIHKLEQMGYIEVVASNQIDPIRSEVEGKEIKKPNVYKIKHKKSLNQNPRQKVLIKTDTQHIDVDAIICKAYTTNVIDFAEIKKHLPKKRFISFKQSL